MTHPHHSLILDEGQIQQKVTRMAYQIYEQNFGEHTLVLAGIHRNGYTLAGMLAQELKKISPIEVTMLQVHLDKTAPLQAPVTLSPEGAALEDAVVIIVDDVLNTGKTLAFTLNALLPHNPRKIEIATLVNRHHTLFPVAATYTGYSLATSLREHVDVVLQENEVAAYLH